MEDGDLTRNRTAFLGTVSVLAGFIIDWVSDKLAMHRVAQGLRLVSEARQDAWSHLGFCLMLFGFAVFAMMVYTRFAASRPPQ